VVCGINAAGKSTIARTLADAIQLKVLSSNVVRKKLFNQHLHESQEGGFEEDMYPKDAKAST
jgi:predicted kinase